MTLNINPAPRTEADPNRRRLMDALLNELLSWNPREFIIAFRRWHHGSFSLIHLNVLTILEADGPDSMSHLADALDVTVASMTGIVDRMEKRGLVERRREDKDRRVVLVYPTEGGRDVFREIDRQRREGLTNVLGRLSDDELAGLLTGHRALRNARADAAATPPPPRLHPPSTIEDKDRPVDPTTGTRP